LLALALALAGCGASHKSPQPPPNRLVAQSHAPQLISMRRIDGATWQTVAIRTDGTGDVGIFIGERTGWARRQFRLGARELAELKRLVAIADRTRETPAFGSNPSTEYIIYAPQRVLETAKGYIPRQLASLTGILSGLIDQYS
jgi:hypothetical protein